MPFASEKQKKFVYAVANGMTPRKGHMTKETAQKFISHSKGGELPFGTGGVAGGSGGSGRKQNKGPSLADVLKSKRR
jgi:hypothetical protein